MLSINYAKKNGDGYVISFYADTVEDITNFDPTKSFGIYGIPQKGSIITLVGGTDSVNYYLGDSGEIVEVEVGGDEPTGDLTPFEVGQTITGIDFGNVQNGDTSAELEELLATYDGTDGGFFSCNSIGLMGGTNILYLFVDENNYTVLYASTSEATGTTGFQNLTNGKFAFAESVTVDNIGTDFITDDWNGVLFGAIEGEPAPSTLTPFVAGQTITGVDFGNVQNGDTNDTLASLLTGLAGQYSGDGIYTLLGRSDGGGIIIFAVDLSKYNGTGYGIVVGETIVYATEANPDGDIQTTVGFQNITDGKVMLPESTQVGEPDAATASTWNGIIMGAVVSE